MINVPQTLVEATLASIYVFVLFVIVTSKLKVFKNPFYSIFVATGLHVQEKNWMLQKELVLFMNKGIADVTSISICCLFRINNEIHGLGPQFELLIRIAGILASSSFVAHMLGNMLIAINRYTALCLREKYDKVWSRRNVCLIIGVQYGCAFAVFIPLFKAEYIFTQNDDGTYFLLGVDRVSDLINRGTYIATCLLYALVSFVLNVRSLILLHSLSKVSEFVRRFHNDRVMLFYTTLVFLFTMLMCTQQVLKGIATVTGADAFHLWVTVQYYWINDVMVSIPPFSLLIFNKELRSEISNFFRCQRYQRSNVVSVSTCENRAIAAGLKKVFDRRTFTRSTY